MQSPQNWLVRLQQPSDFIANMRYDTSSDTFILIHQQPTIHISKGIHNIQHINTKHIQQGTITMKFESNVYDSLRIGNSIITSNHNMPVRLYTLPNDQNNNDNHNLPWISFNDKKVNSQQFLPPLQFAKHQNIIVGGGKKFLSQYDCNKLAVARKVKEMNKKYVSSVELLNDDLVVAGQFDGSLTFLDLRSQSDSQTIKPHFDLVTRIKRVPSRENMLITMARKDNFTYLWDCRKFDTFVNCYELPLYGNQRTGMDVSQDGRTLFMGNQSGNIIGRDIDNQTAIKFNTFTTISRCISSICVVNGGIIYSVGEREFPFQKVTQRSGHIGFLSTQ